MRNWMAARVGMFGKSVFEEASALARHHQAIDLGSGDPDPEVPREVLEALAEAIAGGRNQYSAIVGERELRCAVAAHAARFHGQQVDPLTEVSITCGVTEGVYAAVASTIEPGDEVIVFEPFYDSYVPCIRLAGGLPVPVTLHPPDFRFDPAELEAAISPRTKALILNTPNNPTGKVFSRAELEDIAALCQRFDLLAITDEVYEHVVFDGRRHVRLATLPGMSQRAITLSGASKTFACTGWRVGWAIGPAALQNAMAAFRQYTVFCAATPLQLAIVRGLELPDQYFERLSAEYQARRDLMMNALAGTPFQAFAPAGGFFVLASVPPDGCASGREWCSVSAREAGVVPIPLDTFYLDPRRAANLVRFAFCRRREQLIEAGERLQRLRRVAV